MQRQRVIPSEEMRAIAMAYASNPDATQKSVAKEFNVCDRTVSSACQMHGIKARSRNESKRRSKGLEDLTEAEKSEAMRQYYETPKTEKEIAAAFGTTITVLELHRRVNRLPKRPDPKYLDDKYKTELESMFRRDPSYIRIGWICGLKPKQVKKMIKGIIPAKELNHILARNEPAIFNDKMDSEILHLKSIGYVNGEIAEELDIPLQRVVDRLWAYDPDNTSEGQYSREDVDFVEEARTGKMAVALPEGCQEARL